MLIPYLWQTRHLSVENLIMHQYLKPNKTVSFCVGDQMFYSIPFSQENELN